jgi:putative membrane protein
MHALAVTAPRPVTPAEILGAWTLDPGTLGLLALGALLYAAGAARLRRRGRSPRPARTAAYYGGLAVVAAALVSPLHALGETLFSAHMVQHLTLVLVAAPLLASAAPVTTGMLGIPPGPRRNLLALRRLWPWRAARRTLRNPVVVWSLGAVAMWSWHLPGLYRAALAAPAIHALEHASFLVTALLLWSLVLRTGPRRRLAHGPAILLLFGTALQGAVLGAVLAFAARPLYGLASAGSRAWGLAPLADQQLAGLIMWVPAGAVYIGAMATLFWRWLQEMDATTRPATAAEERT